MKRFIYSISIALSAILFISITPCASAAQQDSLSIENTVVMLSDTTTSLGRKFDRGLTNYRFIPQGEWICGLAVSYTGYNSSDSDIFISSNMLRSNPPKSADVAEYPKRRPIQLLLLIK